MPSLGEAELIHSLVAQESEILELGCGAGRITHELVALGHPVVAVDQSPGMLERVRGAVARGDAVPTSDTDFLVEFEPSRSLFDQGLLVEDLQKLLGMQRPRR